MKELWSTALWGKKYFGLPTLKEAATCFLFTQLTQASEGATYQRALL
jgi:hypothetical protein